MTCVCVSCRLVVLADNAPDGQLPATPPEGASTPLAPPPSPLQNRPPPPSWRRMLDFDEEIPTIVGGRLMWGGVTHVSPTTLSALQGSPVIPPQRRRRQQWQRMMTPTSAVVYRRASGQTRYFWRTITSTSSTVPSTYCTTFDASFSRRRAPFARAAERSLSDTSSDVEATATTAAAAVVTVLSN